MKRMHSNIIGGEFELQFPCKHSVEVSSYIKGDLFASGRAALYHILRFISQNRDEYRIFLPDYLCSSIIDAVKRAEIPFEFYHLSADLSCNTGELITKCRSNDVVLLINYFGAIDYNEHIAALKRVLPDVYVILDNVQAFFDMVEEDSAADFIFTSFRKTIPVPDGGWVISKQGVLPVVEGCNEFASYKIAGGLLKSWRESKYYTDNVYLELSQLGEKLLERDYDSKCSSFTNDALAGLDIRGMAEKRRRNADYVIDRVMTMELQPVLSFKTDAVPLFIPVRLPRRDAVRYAMFKENIFCPIHWTVGDNNKKLIRGLELAETELSLIVDHRYDIDDMDRMMNVLEENL